MREEIITIENDIKKCRNMVESKDLLELAIIIEEVIDKNKYKIKNLENLKKDNVWKYSKKDLENLIEQLENFHHNIVNQYNDSIIKAKLNDKKSRIRKLKEDIQDDLYLDENNKIKLSSIIDDLNYISKENLSKENRWLRVKEYINYLNNCDYITGKYILEGINIIF